MKKYFAKWLRVEDTCFINRQLSRKIEKKMFLCSRNIQVGDKVIFQLLPNKSNWSEGIVINSHADTVEIKDGDFTVITTPDSYVIKKIGEISPAAVPYIQEGQEFDEENILRDILVKDTFDGDYTHYHPKGSEQFVVKGTTEKIIKEHPIKIKCPWGCFH